ncbi:unannotated protein [freshwater metagenome]|uniref:Unannotated protein n=1 Tax=freshwater metagenome TaxID=449393 RepID=A0A6J6TE37_9ZZZZ
MQDAAVASGCMLSELVLLIEDHDGRPRKAGEPRIGEGQADDATADDSDICSERHGLRILAP